MELSARRDGRYAVISVSDDGSGIPAPHGGTASVTDTQPVPVWRSWSACRCCPSAGPRRM